MSQWRIDRLERTPPGTPTYKLWAWTTEDEIRSGVRWDGRWNQVFEIPTGDRFMWRELLAAIRRLRHRHPDIPLHVTPSSWNGNGVEWTSPDGPTKRSSQ